MKKKDGNPDEKVYRPRLKQSEVDGYWQVIGMSREAWLGLSEATRVQTAWTDMLAKQRAANEANRALQDSLDDD